MLERRLADAEAEARRVAARAASPGVETPVFWRLQAADENLRLCDLALPAAAASAPPATSARREAVRQAEAAEAARLLRRFAEQPGGLDATGITKVWRVQNRRLWSRYVDRRGEVASEVERHGGLIAASAWISPSERSSEGGALVGEAGERLLFHGADPGTIAAIVAGGFECRGACSRSLLQRWALTFALQSPAWAALSARAHTLPRMHPTATRTARCRRTRRWLAPPRATPAGGLRR